MNFLFTINDSYATPIQLLLFSIHKNMGGGHVFYFIHKNIVPANQTEIADYARVRCLSEARFIAFNELDLSQLPLCGTWSEEIYFRLFAPYLIPDLDAVLYLDGDTLVTGNLTSIWYEFLQSKKTIGAVANDIQELHIRRLSLPDDAVYINSGVLFMNLKKMRHQNSFEDVWNQLILLSPRLQFPDQDYINIVFAKDLFMLDIRYNYMINLLERSAEYPKRDDFVVCHFVLSKPWNQEFLYKTDCIYLKYLASAGKVRDAISLYYQHRKRRWGTKIKNLMKLR